MSDKDCKF